MGDGPQSCSLAALAVMVLTCEQWHAPYDVTGSCQHAGLCQRLITAERSPACLAEPILCCGFLFLAGLLCQALHVSAGGLACLLCAIFGGWLQRLFAIAGQASAAVAVSLLWGCTTDLFPISVRAAAMHACTLVRPSGLLQDSVGQRSGSTPLQLQASQHLVAASLP